MLFKLPGQWCPVKIYRNEVCSLYLFGNISRQTKYQQGGTDHEQSIHDLLGDIEALSEISF